MAEVNNKTRQQRIEEFLLNPDKVIFESIEELRNAVSEIVQTLSSVDMESLEKLEGEDGYSPQRGVDYWTEEDINAVEQFILSKLPKMGEDLPTPEQVRSFIEIEVSKIQVKDGKDGKQGPPGPAGKDGSPDSGADIVKKVRTLPKNQRFKISDIRGLENKLKSITETQEEFEELKRAFEAQMVVISTGGSGGEGNDANAIHVDEANEFDPVTEESSPASGDFFIAERASDGTKIKVAFSNIGAGADGRTVLNGNGAPDPGDGLDGDFYIDTAANDIYGPKTGGAWGSGTSLIGPTGATGAAGADGADGADGEFISTYQGAWSAGTYTIGQIVTHEGNSWIVTAASTTEEPTGTPTDWDKIAAKGDTGATGATGAQGPAGNDGADADTSELTGVVIHGAVAGTARLTGYAMVTWIGSVEPTNATNNDIWIDTA